MIGRYIHQNGDIGLEVIHVVQLETAQLYHVVVIVLLGHLPCQTASDIAGQPHVHARHPEYVVYERRGCGLAVGSGDAYHLGIGVTPSKLNLRYDGSALSHKFLYDGGLFGNTRALYHLIGRKDALLGMLFLLPLYTAQVQFVTVMLLYFRQVRYKHIKALGLSQNGCSGTALACS